MEDNISNSISIPSSSSMKMETNLINTLPVELISLILSKYFWGFVGQFVCTKWLKAWRLIDKKIREEKNNAYEGYVDIPISVKVLEWARSLNISISRISTERAAYNGVVPVLQWIKDELTNGKCNHLIWSSPYLWTLSAEEGHINVLEWLVVNYNIENKIITSDGGYMWVGKERSLWESKGLGLAAAKGNKHVLEWAKKNQEFVFKKCVDRSTSYWGKNEVATDVCSGAAFGGRLDILMWARDNNCEWGGNACIAAARNGHLEILQWLLDNGCLYSSDVPLAASLNGHLNIIKYIQSTGREIKFESTICALASKGGHRHVLEWARIDNNFKWDAQTTQNAIINHHIDLYEWLLFHHCPTDESTWSDLLSSNAPLKLFVLTRESGLEFPEASSDYIIYTRSVYSIDFGVMVLEKGRKDVFTWVCNDYKDYSPSPKCWEIAKSLGLPVDILKEG